MGNICRQTIEDSGERSIRRKSRFNLCVHLINAVYAIGQSSVAICVATFYSIFSLLLLRLLLLCLYLGIF